MAYNYPQNPQSVSPQPGQSFNPNWGEVVNTLKAPLSGFWQGFSGKNMSYEQWLFEQKRKKRGYPGRQNWLQRLINPRYYGR